MKIKQINLINIMKKNTNRKKFGSKILQPLISYLLFAGIIFTGLPLHLQAQKSDDSDKLEMTGKEVSLIKMSDSIASKMSAESYSEMKAQATQNDSGAISVKSAQNGGSKYAVLNVEFKTPAVRQAVFTDQKHQNLKMSPF